MQSSQTEFVLPQGSLAPSTMMQRTRVWRDEAALSCAVPTALLIMFIVIPLVALVWRATADPSLLAQHVQASGA